MAVVVPRHHHHRVDDHRSPDHPRLMDHGDNKQQQVVSAGAIGVRGGLSPVGGATADTTSTTRGAFPAPAARDHHQQRTKDDQPAGSADYSAQQQEQRRCRQKQQQQQEPSSSAALLDLVSAEIESMRKASSSTSSAGNGRSRSINSSRGGGGGAKHQQQRHHHHHQTAYHTFFPPACLKLLQGLEGNQRCVDCGEHGPQWAAVSYGALLCLQCSGKHRSLGVQVSCVRSIRMDEWTLEQVLTMLEGGTCLFLFSEYGYSL